MKSKTYRLKQLEKNRFSIVTDDLSICYICGMPRQDLHEIFEGCHRSASMRYGLVLPLCRYHHQMIHSNRQLALQYKILFQKEFEKNHTREEFIKIFKRNYI